MSSVLTACALGATPYREGLALQEALVRARAAGETGDWLLYPDHPPVLTIGRNPSEGNLRADTAALAAAGVEVFEVPRGGDVTWHGPGQLVAYPILKLEGAARDLHAHLHLLEDLMIEVCAELGLAVGRDPRNTGVWANGRKVGSIGIACRRWVTWHGLALNVDPDLAYFGRINPCGFDASVMTSVARELDRPVALADARRALVARVSGW